MKKLKAAKYLLPGFKSKTIVEPLIEDSSRIFTDMTGDSSDGASRGSTNSNASWRQPPRPKGRRCPVWLNLVSIGAGILGVLIMLVLLFLYWRPDGWRDDGHDSIKLTLLATIGAALLGVLSCFFILYCAYCLVCHAEFWQKRKWNKFLEREEKEMQSIAAMEDRHQQSREERKARHDAYRTRAHELRRGVDGLDDRL